MKQKKNIIIGLIVAIVLAIGVVLAVKLFGDATGANTSGDGSSASADGSAGSDSSAGGAGSTGADTDVSAADYSRAYIKQLAEAIDFTNLDPYQIYREGIAESGNLPDNVKGSADAPIVIYEYADYQCSHCAEWNESLNEVVEGMNGVIAVAMRSYVLSYNTKGVQAAAAAEAAALQGFWTEYKDLLFANQADWYYASAERFQTLLEQYFKQVAGANGNLNKFRADMQSEAVAQKLAFDMGMGTKLELKGTPAFYIDGEYVAPADLKDTLIAKVAELKNK